MQSTWCVAGDTLLLVCQEYGNKHALQDLSSTWEPRLPPLQQGDWVLAPWGTSIRSLAMT